MRGVGKNSERTPIYEKFRSGDVRHSQADISKAVLALGYSPQYTLSDGMPRLIGYMQKMSDKQHVKVL